MTTSANVTYYEISDSTGKVLAENRQHALCKNTIKDWLKTFEPAEKFFIQMNHPDEEECSHYSKWVNLKDYLDGKYKHTMWANDDTDENVNDTHYCAEHDYMHLKEDCPECLRKERDMLINCVNHMSQFCDTAEVYHSFLDVMSEQEAKEKIDIIKKYS